MKLVILITVLFPFVALMVGYKTHPVEATQVHPVVTQIVDPIPAYLITQYKYPESDIVVTVNQFPFDVGGNMPFQISVHGEKYTYSPEDVREFLAKGTKLNIKAVPLPTGMWHGDSPFDMSPPVN